MSWYPLFPRRTNELEAEKDVQSEEIMNVFPAKAKSFSRSEIGQVLLAMTSFAITTSSI